MIVDYIDYNDDSDYSGYEDVQVHWHQPVSVSERHWIETRIQKHGDNWLNQLTGKFTPYRKD